MDSEQHLRTRSCIYQHGLFASMDKAPSSSSRLTFSLGIDIGKTALELALRDGKHTVGRTTVSNDPQGHENLMDWLQDRGAGPEKTCVCMEASGDFQEAVARFLHDEGYRVSVVNPRRITEADQRVRCESAPTHEDRRCRCGLNCSLRLAGRPKGVGTAFSGGEPTSGAYKSSTGSEEREDPYSKSTG